jgi:hypothetical protein
MRKGILKKPQTLDGKRLEESTLLRAAPCVTSHEKPAAIELVFLAVAILAELRVSGSIGLQAVPCGTALNPSHDALTNLKDGPEGQQIE